MAAQVRPAAGQGQGGEQGASPRAGHRHLRAAHPQDERAEDTHPHLGRPGLDVHAASVCRDQRGFREPLDRDPRGEPLDPDRFDETADPYGTAIADLAGTEPITEPGTDFEYASANYLVLGALVQSVTGMPYEDYLRQAVLGPLGMDTTVADAEAAESIPDGHTYAFGRSVAIDAPFDPTGPSYGYLGGTVTDLAAFAAASLPGGDAVLTPESTALMQTPAVAMNERIDYGLGWKIDDRNADLGTTTVWHTGGAPGYSAAVILLPELGRAVVVAQNAYGHFQDGALVATALGAARIVAGGEPTEPETDWLYPATLTAIALLLILSIAVVIRSIHEIRKGPKPATRRWTTWAAMTAWTIGGLTVAYTAAIALPAMAPSRTLFNLMAPDLAYALYALALTTLAAAATRLWYGATRLKSVDASGRGPDPLM